MVIRKNIIIESNVKILEGIVLIYSFVHTSEKALCSFTSSIIVIWSLNYSSNDPNTQRKESVLIPCHVWQKPKLNSKSFTPWWYEDIRFR